MANKKAVSDFRKLTVQYAESPVDTTLDVNAKMNELQSVDGDLSDLQAKYMAAAAETAIRSLPDGQNFQIGASNLTATMILASLFHEKNRNALQLVDPDNKAANVNQLAETSVRGDTSEKISHSTKSVDSFFLDKNPSVSFALIDACDDYSDAKQIYQTCADHTETGSLIAAFDVDNEACAASLKAFREVLLDQPQWVLWAHCKNLAVVRREF